MVYELLDACFINTIDMLDIFRISELTEEDLQDPWSHSDWDNMLLSVVNIWKTSPVKRVCDRIKGNYQVSRRSKEILLVN